MKFKIMGKKGDNVAVYEDIETQEMKFNELMGSGYLPIAVKHGENETNVKMDLFDPTVKEILWMPKLGGG